MNLDALLTIVEIVRADADRREPTDVKRLADDLAVRFSGLAREDLLTLINLSVTEVTRTSRASGRSAKSLANNPALEA